MEWFISDSDISPVTKICPSDSIVTALPESPEQAPTPPIMYPMQIERTAIISLKKQHSFKRFSKREQNITIVIKIWPADDALFKSVCLGNVFSVGQEITH